MNKILKLAAVLAVGSASVAVYAQSEADAQGEAYGQFRPLQGQTQAAAPQTAAQPAPAPEAPPAQPEQPAAQPEPESAQAQAPAPTQVQSPAMAAPYGYGPGAGYGPGHMDPFGAHSWARYEERKRFMRDRQMFRRYAGPRRGYYGRHSRFGTPYGGPVPYHGVPQAPAAAAPAPEEGQAPEAAAQPGY